MQPPSPSHAKTRSKLGVGLPGPARCPVAPNPFRLPQTLPPSPPRDDAGCARSAAAGSDKNMARMIVGRAKCSRTQRHSRIATRTGSGAQPHRRALIPHTAQPPPHARPIAAKFGVGRGGRGDSMHGARRHRAARRRLVEAAENSGDRLLGVHVRTSTARTRANAQGRTRTHTHPQVTAPPRTARRSGRGRRRPTVVSARTRAYARVRARTRTPRPARRG